MLTTTNIWELYWILSSQVTKTFRDNCNKNIVQQTSCDCLIWWFVVGALQLQWSCSATTEFLQFQVSFHLFIFVVVLGEFPAALPYTVRLVRRLQCQFTRSW